MKLSKRIYCLGVCLPFCIVLGVEAVPQGAEVIAGDVIITTQQNEMLVQQSTRSAVIHYESFNVGENETVTFQQPDSQSVTLNRVLGGSRSDIFGQINSNGKVFLVNPSGIFFSESAQLDVGGLVASTLDISDGDMSENTWVFEGDSSAQIVNRGEIFSRDNGYVAFISNDITNAGNIDADNGKVALLSGRRVVIGFDDEAIAYDVTDLAESASISNLGDIQAGLGVSLEAHSLDAIENIVINNEGIIHASGFAMEDGEIVISSESGSIVNSGIVELDNAQSPLQGIGEINIDSTRFINFGAVTANAIETGDGGSINIHSSDALYLADDSLTAANGAGEGNGGTIIHYSEGTTWFTPDAQSHARAGELAGDGGFIEVSGEQQIAYAGQVDTSAQNGDDGWLLIDPSNIDITDAGGIFFNPGTMGSTIILDPIVGGSFVSTFNVERTLQSGNNVRISTANTDTPGEEGTLTVVDEIDLTGIAGQNLILQSNGDMSINANICASDGAGGCVSGSHDSDLFFETFSGDGGSIIVADDVIIDSGDGGITMDSDVDITLGENSELEAGGSMVELLAGGILMFPDSGLSIEGELNVIADDMVDRSGRLLDINADRIVLSVHNPLGEVTISGRVYNIDVHFLSSGDFTLNALNSIVNLQEEVSINDVDLFDGDFSLNIIGPRNTDIALLNYSNVNNISLINPTTFGVTRLPGGIDIAGDVTLQATIVADLTDSRDYFIRADTFNLETLSFGGRSVVTTDVNTFSLNFSPTRIQNVLTINEADDIVINGLTQNGINTLELNAGGDITFNNQADLSHVGDAAVQHNLTVNSTGGSIIFNTDFVDSSANQNTGTLINLDAANDIVFSSGIRMDSNGGDINLVAGGSVQINDSAVVDVGNAVFSSDADAIVSDGTIISESTDIQAIMLSSSTSVSGSGSGLLQAPNGGLVLNAQTGINIGTSAAFLNAQNQTSGDVVIREFDALSLTDLIAPSGVSISLTSGELIIPDAGINVSGQLNLSADSVVNSVGGALSLTANELVFSANNLSSAMELNTNVNALDARAVGQNLTVVNQSTLNILDLNGDGRSIEVNDGNLNIEVLAGDLTVNDQLIVRDVSANGERTGLMLLQVNAGDVLIGNSGPSTIELESLIDNRNVSSLDNEYSTNAVAVIHQNDSRGGVSQLVLGNASGDNVNINIRGGDFVADFYDEVGGLEQNAILINNGVSLDLNNGNTGGNDGYLFAQGVDTSEASLSIGREYSGYLIREQQPLFKLGNEPDRNDDALIDVYPDDTDVEENVSEVTFDVVDTVLGFEDTKCSVIGGNVKDKRCRLDQAYRRFFNAFLISGQLPSLVESTVE